MKKLLLITFLIILSLVGLLSVGHLLLDHSSLHSISQVIVQHHWIFRVWRYALYISVLIMWPYIIKRLAKKYAWSSEMIEYLIKQRWKLLILMVLLEVFFAENLLGHLITWL